MKHEVLSIFDNKTKHYDKQVAVVVHVGDAIREIEDLKKDDKTKFGKHPADFELHWIGEFDTKTGCMTTFETPRVLA